MNNIEFKSSNRTSWSNKREVVSQPLGIDYEKLSSNLNENKVVDNRLKSIENTIKTKDLRKTSFKDTDVHTKDDSSLKNVDKKSIIPVPGLLIDLEDSGSDTRPPDSDWIAPHGPQWGPMTQ